MTDREPLRVGPLVLRWTQLNPHGLKPRYGYTGMCAGGLRLTIKQGQVGFWACEGHQIGCIAAGSLGKVIDDSEEWLRAHGYLAQYRSRRRLLARECERRARELRTSGWDLHESADAYGESAKLACLGAGDVLLHRAAKYTRWANQLKDSP